VLWITAKKKPVFSVTAGQGTGGGGRGGWLQGLRAHLARGVPAIKGVVSKGGCEASAGDEGVAQERRGLSAIFYGCV